MKRALESKWTQQQAFISNVSILIHATSERPEGGQRRSWMGLQHRLSTYPKKHNKQILRHPVDAVDPPHVGEMQSFHVPRHWRCAEEWELWTTSCTGASGISPSLSVLVWITMWLLLLLSCCLVVLLSCCPVVVLPGTNDEKLLESYITTCSSDLVISPTQCVSTHCWRGSAPTHALGNAWEIHQS
jgi:hypothetical protein